MDCEFDVYYSKFNANANQEWEKTCLYVLDTNVLLDIYRVGDSLSKKILTYFDSLNEKVKIPHHVAEEYHNNFYSVIVGYYQKYKDIINKDIENIIIKAVKSELQLQSYPKIEAEISKDIASAVKNIKDTAQEKYNYFENCYKKGDLQQQIYRFIKEHKLEKLSKEKLNKIAEEGEERYAKGIPPGYKDESKNNGNKFGDLIIWNEILQFAEEKKCSIILISNDVKEDWVLKCKGMHIGPRFELLKEYKTYSPNGYFFIKSLFTFLSEREDFNLEDDEKKILENLRPVHIDNMEQKTKASSPTCIDDDSQTKKVQPESKCELEKKKG